MIELELVYRDPRTLKVNARNAKKHPPEQVRGIRASIDRFNFNAPILLKDDEATVGAGHGRLEAALLPPAYAKVPTITLRGLSEADWRAYVIADNKLAEQGVWDLDILKAELLELQGLGVDLDLTGFGEFEVKGLFGEAAGRTSPDKVPPVPKKGLSRPGDLWLMGPHRLLCGDSTLAPDVGRLMNGGAADALWTDPPYNVNYQGTAGSIQNDHMADAAFRAFLDAAFARAFEALREGGAAYVAHADTEGLNFRAAFRDAGFKLSGCLIWRKNSLVLGRSDYQWQHEPILYGWKPGAAHRWFGDRKKTTIMDLGGEVVTDNGDGTLTLRVGLEAVVISGRNLKIQPVETTVINVEKPKKSADHPTTKPVELITRMLKNSAETGEVVLDLFGGSGSTLIAAEVNGLQARLMELDPRFVDVIVTRWQEFTGRTATLEGDGRSFSQVMAERA